MTWGELLIATVSLRGLNLQTSAARSPSSRAVAEVKVMVKMGALVASAMVGDADSMAGLG